mgnify:CR=1 FL=1
MARIAEDLLLLLLDNASAKPVLPRRLSRRLSAAAVLLDLAYDGRVRPALPNETAQGCLVALVGPPPLDPVVRPALTLLQRAPLTPASAVRKLSKHVEDDVLDQLLRTGQIRQVQLESGRFKANEYAWPMKDRSRVDAVRAAVLGVLFEDQFPDPPTAAVISLLYACDGIGVLLSLNDRGHDCAMQRAGEISSGSWISENEMAEINLGVTIAAVRHSLM